MNSRDEKRVVLMRFKWFLSIVVLTMFLGCAHQEDVIILDQRLAKMEALGKKLDQKTASLEKRAVSRERKNESSSKENEQNRA